MLGSSMMMSSDLNSAAPLQSLQSLLCAAFRSHTSISRSMATCMRASTSVQRRFIFLFAQQAAAAYFAAQIHVSGYLQVIARVQL